MYAKHINTGTNTEPTPAAIAYTSPLMISVINPNLVYWQEIKEP
jgi:hypothetical protein